ncbi:MAG: hypothetical protein PGN33_16590 [Methylobacterium radiotolerans]
MPDIGRQAAASRADTTRAKCEAAMREIEAAVDANKGVYPNGTGEINIQEVLRVAKLSSSVLEKPHHVATKEKVQAWLQGINKRTVHGASSIRRLVTERADAAKDETREIMAVWHEADLDYHENRIALARLAEENALLRDEVARLRAELAGENVVRMRRKGQD